MICVILVLKSFYMELKMISILMPIYNGIEFIEESVSSIINQTYSNWELIIGINGWPPGSEVYQHAKQYEKDTRIKVLDLDTSIKGKSAALNEMIKYCKYDWISLLDVDDKWLPTKLELQIPFMNDYDVIGTLCQYFGELSHSLKLPTGNITTFDFLIGNPIINSSCLVKKAVPDILCKDWPFRSALQ